MSEHQHAYTERLAENEIRGAIWVCKCGGGGWRTFPPTKTDNRIAELEQALAAAQQAQRDAEAEREAAFADRDWEAAERARAEAERDTAQIARAALQRGLSRSEDNRIAERQKREIAEADLQRAREALRLWQREALDLVTLLAAHIPDAFPEDKARVRKWVAAALEATQPRETN